MKKIYLVILIICLIIGGVYMAHEKANLICDDMCLVEGLPKEDIAVLTGQITLNVGTTGSYVELDYPEGFNKNNSIVISQMIKLGSVADYMSGVFESSGGIVKFYTKLTSTIDVNCYLPTTIPTELGNLNYYYKIALMKIS